MRANVAHNVSVSGKAPQTLSVEGATQAPVMAARMLQAAHVFETERKVKKIPDRYSV
ncbi:MAG TPA: hypothetical protein VHO84_11115 [Syntrophorhabdaceae bacterium]|nr:hypothetical protein [Syntrophorhabdaceae bacterium]